MRSHAERPAPFAAGGHEPALEHPERAHRLGARPGGGASGISTVCASGAGSSTWKLADMLRMAPTA